MCFVNNLRHPVDQYGLFQAILFHFHVSIQILGAVVTKHSIIDLKCIGNKNSILDCPYNGSPTHSSFLSKDFNIFYK